MQRAIRFRAWDKFQKKYIFTGFHICGEVTAFGGMEIEISETWKARSAALGYTSTIEAWDDFIFEQFTGLVDKNGKDIYEGDRFLAMDDSNRCNIYEWEVVFDEGEFAGLHPYDRIGLHFWDSSEIEIIGNVNEK